MLKRLTIVGLMVLLLLNIPGNATQILHITDSLNILLEKKNLSDQKKLDILYKIIDYNNLSGQYEDMGIALNKAFILLEKGSDSCQFLKFSLMKAKHALSINDKTQASLIANSVLESSRINKCDELQVSALIFQAQLLLRHQNPDTCLKLIQKAKDLAIDIGDDLLVARAENMKGIYYFIKYKYHESRKQYFSVIESFTKSDEFAMLGKLYYDIAYTYYLQSSYDSALYFNNKAIPILEKGYNFIDLVHNYNNMGIIYQNIGKLNEAIEAYFLGLTIADHFNLDHNRTLFLYNIGNCYYSLDAKDKAIANYRLCLNMAENAQDTSSIIYSCNAIGILALEDNIIDTAHKYLSKSFKFAKLVNNNYMMQFGYTSMGSLESERGNYKLAQEYINEAYKTARIYNNPDDLININISQAMLYSKQKYYDKSIKLLNETHTITLNINSLESNGYIIEALQEVYEESGDYLNALIFSKKLKSHQDSVNSSSILKNLITTENQYEQEKIEKIRELQEANAELERMSELKNTKFIAITSIIATIALVFVVIFISNISRHRKKRNQNLRDKNKLVETHRDELKEVVSKLQKTTDELNSSNKTKSKLLSIIGHDLKNPFNVIQGYISLLTEDNPDPTTRQLYYGRINIASDQLMEMVENLLIWSNAQTNKINFNPTLNNFAEICDHSISVLQNNANLKSIEIVPEYDSKEKSEIYVDSDMISRILHNLVVNAIKFTERNGKIYLGFEIKDAMLNCWIKDTGIGMDPKDAASIFQKSTEFVKNGTDGERGTGLGLSICYDFVKSHNGTIWAESEVGKGASFKFKFPVL